MSRNNQFISSDQFHEGFWTTQPNLDSTQINPYSRFQDSIVPDHHHLQGTQFHNPQQNHQLVWLPTNFNTQGNVSLSNYQAHSLSNFQQQQQQQQQIEEDEKQNEEEEEREYLFEKPLTPSDVGKLNRLVIPKQHAEKYFPLGGNDSLLSFEDESGKQWRFRYSYWNSSQSYVLTKGWSRYVKEKQLESGDIVAFERLPGERLFIRWRRRATTTTATAVVQDGELAQVVPNSTAPWTQSFYSAHPYPSHPHHINNMQIFYQTPYLHAAEPVAQNTTIPEVPVNSRRLRLFGVNFDCQIDEESEPSSSDCLSQSEAQISSYSTSLWSGPQ